MDAKEGDEPRRTGARERRNVHLRTNKTALFDIVRTDGGQRFALRAATSHARVPGERSETRDPGRHDESQPAHVTRFALFALGPGSRSARASALAALARDTRLTQWLNRLIVRWHARTPALGRTKP